MSRFRHPSATLRLLLGALLALCLGVRLLTPAGFMPSFADGSLTIVECPGAEGFAPLPPAQDMAGMDMPGMAMLDTGHHGDEHGFHQTCPFAQAASLDALDLVVAVVLCLVLLAALPPRARALLAISRRATRDRPPSQGPPIPA